MKKEMDVKQAKEELTELLKEYKIFTKKFFNFSSKDGFNRATDYLKLIANDKDSDTLGLVAMLVQHPKFKDGSNLRERIIPKMLEILGVEEDDIKIRAKKLAANTDFSEKGYMDRASLELLTEKVAKRLNTKEEKSIEMQNIEYKKEDPTGKKEI